MPTTTWNVTTIDGKEYLVIDTAAFRIPLDWDPNSNMFIAVAAPTGGLGAFPALVKGDTGDMPTLETAVNFTALEADDPTVDSASFTELAPGNYQLDLVLHKGPQGDVGDTTVTPSDFGTPVAGRIPVVNDALDSFDLAAQKVGDRYIPASIANTPLGNPNYTLCSVAIPAQPFDWRPHVEGQAVITVQNGWVTVDLVARLNDAVAGNIVGKGFHVPADTRVLDTQCVLSAGPPPGATADYDKVLAGEAATIYLRAERRAGAYTYTTTAATTYFSVRVCPIP